MSYDPGPEDPGCLYIGIVTVAFFAVLMALVIALWMLIT